ncbi:hypothetical protein OSTOST_23227, partial [Ostertagia ostertagi]
MESVGKQVQPFKNPQATGSAAYVTKNDIPSHIVKFVNDFMIAENGTSSLTVDEHYPEFTSSSCGVGSYMDTEDGTEFHAVEKPSDFKKEISSIINSIEEPTPAQYIATEMESIGKSLAKFRDRKNFQGKAYVTVYEIPSKVVKLVNDFLVAMK